LWGSPLRVIFCDWPGCPTLPQTPGQSNGLYYRKQSLAF
jgi:hypothetical protein